jgi:hypothetical protein
MYQKILSRTGVVAQAVDCLPSKHEALNSNPSTAGEEKKKKRYSQEWEKTQNGRKYLQILYLKRD